jgi:hypothetical protein
MTRWNMVALLGVNSRTSGGNVVAQIKTYTSNATSAVFLGELLKVLAKIF